MPAKQTMSDDAISTLVSAQIEMAIAAPGAWEENRKALLMLPEGERIVNATLDGIRDRKRKVQIANATKTAISTDDRPEDFDARMAIVVDAMIAISENVEIFKWENVGGRGTDKRFKARAAQIPVMNGTISFTHKSEIRKAQ